MTYRGLWRPSALYLPGDVAFIPGGGLMRRASLDEGDWEPLETFQGDFDPDAEYQAGDVVIKDGALLFADISGRWAVVAEAAR
jgi:hypothetical protein